MFVAPYRPLDATQLLCISLTFVSSCFDLNLDLIFTTQPHSRPSEYTLRARRAIPSLLLPSVGSVDNARFPRLNHKRIEPDLPDRVTIFVPTLVDPYHQIDHLNLTAPLILRGIFLPHPRVRMPLREKRHNLLWLRHVWRRVFAVVGGFTLIIRPKG